ILNRTVMVPTHPLHSQEEIADVIHDIQIAARVALGGLSRAEADIRKASPVDAQKFDMKLDAARA
ncbi:MAG: aminotransferase class I/II-fold pyridoxal phosphate-dependent enzyme, partial [Geminicoccales bacterium]